MAETTLQLILSLLTLAGAIFAWWVKKKAEKQKEKDDLDKKIDEANSIIDFIDIDDKLRK